MRQAEAERAAQTAARYEEVAAKVAAARAAQRAECTMDMGRTAGGHAVGEIGGAPPAVSRVPELLFVA